MLCERQRQQQIQQLHYHIYHFQPSQQDIQGLQNAYEQLHKSIEYKFQKSSVNQNYKFPTQHPQLPQDYSNQKQIINLNKDFPISLDSSIADEPPTNQIYSFEKTSFPASKNVQTPLKIKLFKKKDRDSSINRLKTEYLTSAKKLHSEKKSKGLELPPSKINFTILRERMKIEDITKSPYKLPLNKTMRTQYTPVVERGGRSFDKMKTQFSKKKELSRTLNEVKTNGGKKNISMKIQSKAYTSNKENKENNKENNKQSKEERKKVKIIEPRYSTLKLTKNKPIEKKWI